MEKFFGKIILVAFVLFAIVAIGVFLLIGMFKLAVFLIVMFLVNSLIGSSHRGKEANKIRLSLALDPQTRNFRTLEFVKFILVWVLYLGILVYRLPGLRVGINFLDFGWDTITLCLHIFSSTIYTKHGQVRILYGRYTEKLKLILPPGYFLSPAIWFRFRVSDPMIISYTDGKLQLLPIEEENPNENIFHLYKDDRIAKIRTQMKGGAALFYNFLLINSRKIRFTDEWNPFRIIVSIFLALIINFTLYFTVLDSYYYSKTENAVVQKIRKSSKDGKTYKNKSWLKDIIEEKE